MEKSKFLLGFVFLLVGCGGVKDSTQTLAPSVTDSSATGVGTDTTAVGIEYGPLEIESMWAALVEKENAFSASDVSVMPDASYALMAAPRLRLFRFDGPAWTDITSEVNLNEPDHEFDYDIRITSARVTNDDALDFIVNFTPAPWDCADVPNQCRDYGVIISGHGGNWRPLNFFDPYGDGVEYNGVQGVYLSNGALLGGWWGSQGRGTLLYSWVNGSQRLEGVDATKAQIKGIGSRYCAAFRYNETFPIVRCDKSQGVSYAQQSLVSLGYLFEADGYFGDDTQFSVQYFQRANSLRATGRIDLDTWKILMGNSQLPGYDLNNDGVVGPDELSGN